MRNAMSATTKLDVFRNFYTKNILVKHKWFSCSLDVGLV
jgi:hypothetical protein